MVIRLDDCCRFVTVDRRLVAIVFGVAASYPIQWADHSDVFAMARIQIDSSRFDVGVTKQFLDRADIRSKTRRCVAKLWRITCELMCLSIPAAWTTARWLVGMYPYE